MKSCSEMQLSLHELAAKNHVEQLTSLLDLRKSQGVSIDLNEKNNDHGRTALHIAAERNVGSSHYKMAEILLKNGADPNAEDNNGETPLWELVRCADVQILKLFLRFKADFTCLDQDGFALFKPAIEAECSYNQLDVVKFIVQDIGLDVNFKDDFGRTSLHTAAQSNVKDSHYEILEFLLESGADANALDSEGYTPIFYLVRSCNLKVFELFLKHNADVHAVSEKGYNILSALERSNKDWDFQVLEKLIRDFKLDVSHSVRYKPQLLHYIFNYDGFEQINIKIIKFLVKNGADIDAPDKYGSTPLINILRQISMEEDEWFLCNLDSFNFAIDQTDFSVAHNNVHIFDYYYYQDDDDYYGSPSDYVWTWILEHLAKLKYLSIPIHPIVLKFIEDETNYKDYFENCTEELKAMSEIKPQNCWINYFNILINDRRKLKNYAANDDLIQDLKNNDWTNKFPIYGASMKKNIEKGLKRRKLFDESSILLSDCLPIFNSTHLIVKDIFDCILSKKDLKKFCE